MNVKKITRAIFVFGLFFLFSSPVEACGNFLSGVSESTYQTILFGSFLVLFGLIFFVLFRFFHFFLQYLNKHGLESGFRSRLVLSLVGGSFFAIFIAYYLFPIIVEKFEISTPFSAAACL